MSELVALIGLGNPGAEYAQTRHNAGFWWIDALAREAAASLRPEAKFHSHAARATLGGRDVLLVQPQTFMNRSGQAVQRPSRAAAEQRGPRALRLRREAIFREWSAHASKMVVELRYRSFLPALVKMRRLRCSCLQKSQRR